MYEATPLIEFLNSQGIAYKLQSRATTATAGPPRASDRVVEHSVKTVLAVGRKAAMVVVLPADRGLDLERLEAVSGEAPLRIATEEEFARTFPECEPGTMPPFGHLYSFEVYIDERIAAASEVTFNACNLTHIVTLSGKDFLRAAQGVVGNLSRTL